MLACKKCQSKLVAYLHHKLTPAQRRQVSRHLDTCEKCYTVYLQHQDLSQNLAQIVPLIGKNQRTSLDRVWSAVQKDINRPRHAPASYSARYGLAVLAVMFMLLIPLTLGNQNLP